MAETRSWTEMSMVVVRLGIGCLWGLSPLSLIIRVLGVAVEPVDGPTVELLGQTGYRGIF